MPRKNKRKTEPHKHAPSIHDRGYKAKCIGCAFAGAGFVCLTSDGNCLKIKPNPTSQPNQSNQSHPSNGGAGNSDIPLPQTKAVVSG